MNASYRLVVESGADQGACYPVPERGCSLGRSSQNDIALKDGQLSRLHCRFQFRQGELWVTDMASANGTLVDDVEISERCLEPGCRIRVGDTTLRLEKEGASQNPPTAGADVADRDGDAVPFLVVAGDAERADASSVDLGLAETDAAHGPVERRLKRMLAGAVAVFVALMAVAALVRKIVEVPPSDTGLRPLAVQDAPRTLELRYEKVEGTAENLFRYELVLDASGVLAVAIDDLSQSRHVRRESPSPVAADLLRQLGRQIEQSGFFALDPAYEGIGLPNTLVSYDLTVILGLDARRVRVLNRNEPDVFRTVRERIEAFVRNELGLWAVEFPRDRLERMAHDAYLLGKKLVQERDIQTGNLFAATRSFQECANFLETVEPKPAFFGEALAARRDANEELDRRYTEQNFRADRAIKLRDWDVAASELRVLLDLIPDRADERYRDAERRLLDVEARLKDRRSP